MTDETPSSGPTSDRSPGPASGPASPDGAPTGVNGLFAKLQADTSGILSLLVVVGVGVVLSYVLWEVFAQPTKLVNDAIGDKNCASKQPGTGEMRTCAATVAAWKMVGPLGIGVLAFVLRRRLTTGVTKVANSIHPGGRALVAPVLATLLFLLVWAGVHTTTGGQTGIVPQKAFPAVIGAYTFAVVRYGPALQGRMPVFFDRRDRLPVAVRLVITLAVPTLVSLLITNQERVSQTALKEQFVVLVGLALAYLMLSPRGGDIAGAVARRAGTTHTGNQRGTTR